MPNANRKSNNRWLYAALIVIVIVVLAVVFYAYRPFHKKSATIPSTTSLGTPASNQSGTGNSTSGSNSSSGGSGTGTNQPAASNLVSPWGNFVSNHYPGQNGAPTAETSTCNTSPGATCYIHFTNGSKTRNLDSKVANANGAVIWNWDVKEAGFSSGNWQIKAIATLDGQKKSSDDSLPLVIK